MKKLLPVGILTATLLSATIAFAEHTSVLRSSSEATAGSWESETSSAINATNSDVYGGDVGVNFYYTPVGLNPSFDQTSNRTIIAQVYENDYLQGSTKAREIEGSFGFSGGYYRPCYWGPYTYTKTSKIEGDGRVELYLDWKVQSLSSDTSSALNEGLLSYKLWVY